MSELSQKRFLEIDDVEAGFQIHADPADAEALPCSVSTA